MEERTYHNRLVNLLFNTSTNVIRRLLHFLVQTHKDYGNLDDFLLKKKRQIEMKRIGILNLKTLFPTRKRPTNLDEWDLQLLCFIVCDIFKPEFLVQSSVNFLRNIRNYLCHGPSTKILKVDYEATVKRIREINDKLLNKIGDTNFKQEIDTETDNIIHDKFDIHGAFDYIRDWYELDDSHKQKCSFDTVHRQAFQKLIQDPHRNTAIPETKLIIIVQNCDKEKEAKICKMLADNINRKRLRNENFGPLSDDETAELSRIIEDTLQEMLNEGQIVVKADVGCVILTVASGSFASIAQLWTKCMNGELTKAFNTLQFHLRQIYKNQVELDVIVPEYEFWEVIDIFENPLEYPNRSCLEGQVVNVVTHSFENGTEIEMVIQPHSEEQLEHMKEYSSSGKLDVSLKKMAAKLEEQLDLERLTISSKFILKETKVRCVICMKSVEEAGTEPLVCGHLSVCLGCYSTLDGSTCTICGEKTVRCVNCKKCFEEEVTKPLVCGHLSVCLACNSTHDYLTCTTCGEKTGADSAQSATIGTMSLQETVSKPKTYQKHVNAPFQTVFCVMCTNAFYEVETKLLVCNHKRVCRGCIKQRNCTCSVCDVVTARCFICKKHFEEAETEPIACGHLSVCRECKRTRDCITCTKCGEKTVRCAICKKIDEVGTEYLVCDHLSVCRRCNSTHDYLTCTTCGETAVRCVNCEKYFEEEDTELLSCGHGKICHTCYSTRDYSACSICECEKVTGDEIPVVSATDLKEPVHCGPIKEKEGILGLFKTRWCAIQNGTFFIFRKQSGKKQKKAFKLSGFKFRAKEKKDLCFELFRDDSKKIYQFKALCWEDYKQWQECIANGGYPLTGNSSFRDTDVNPNKQQTDRRYQRFHTW